MARGYVKGLPREDFLQFSSATRRTMCNRYEVTSHVCDGPVTRQRRSTFFLPFNPNIQSICSEFWKGNGGVEGGNKEISSCHMLEDRFTSLGGHFGPEKKYLAPPPPPIPQFAADTLPPPRPSPSWRPPPLVEFSIKNRPPPHLPAPRSPPFPSPEQKKIKNIRNVHQGPFL